MRTTIHEHVSAEQAAAGFTMIEAVVAAALIALAATLVAPSFVAWRMRDRVEARAHLMLASLAYARAESVRLGVRVAICRSDMSGRCLPPGSRCEAERADWSCGWAVVAVGAAAQPQILRRVAPDAALAVSGAQADVVFTPPAGQVIGGFRRFELAPYAALADSGGERWRRCVRIAAGGRARLTEGACGVGA